MKDKNWINIINKYNLYAKSEMRNEIIFESFKNETSKYEPG